MHSNYLIPVTGEAKKNQTKSSHFECYNLGSIDDKVQLIITPIHTDKANYDVHGTYHYKVKNLSHFEVNIEIDFKNSSNINTKENNSFEPNKTLFKAHIEPFQDLELPNSPKNIDEESGICIVQYNKGYWINANIRCTFTYPSPEKQFSFVAEDHKEIFKNLDKWKRKYKPSFIEQMILFNPHKPYESLFDFYEPEPQAPTKKTKFHTPKTTKINTDNEMSKKMIYFIDETFPPCQVEKYTIDLSKEIKTNSKFSTTELDKDKIKTVVFHYRPLDDLIPDKTKIWAGEDFSPYDITYGLIKNINIISVFAHLTQYSLFLKLLFPENQYNKMGIYKVRLFLMGAWTTLYVDKYIPCFPLYFPIYTYSTKSIWPSLLEKAIAKAFNGYDNLPKINFFDLYTILTGKPVLNLRRFEDKFYANTNHIGQLSESFTREQVIDMINSKNYLMSAYASKEFADSNYVVPNEDKRKDLFGKVFPIISADSKSIYLKTIYFLQIKKYVNCSLSDNNTIEINWTNFFSLFDSIILVQINITDEINFRNGFIRCLDDFDESDLESTLAHTYYEFSIVKKNKDKPGPFQVTFVATLSNDHFLDQFYSSPEIDWKFGILKLQKNTLKAKKGKEYSQDDPLKGRSVKIITTPSYTTGYSLVLNMKLEEGDYIIAPITTGENMKQNSNIIYKSYTLKDNENKAIPIQDTIISKFLDDLFYLNEPFGYNFVQCPPFQKITSLIFDNNGKNIKPIEENAFKSYCLNLKDNNGKYGLSKLLFKDYLFDKMNLINEKLKKETMLILGYNYNTYPYLGRFFSFSIYFSDTDNLNVNEVQIHPCNNIIDNNIPYIITKCEEIMKK